MRRAWCLSGRRSHGRAMVLPDGRTLLVTTDRLFADGDVVSAMIRRAADGRVVVSGGGPVSGRLGLSNVPWNRESVRTGRVWAETRRAYGAEEPNGRICIRGTAIGCRRWCGVLPVRLSHGTRWCTSTRSRRSVSLFRTGWSTGRAPRSSRGFGSKSVQRWRTVPVRTSTAAARPRCRTQVERSSSAPWAAVRSRRPGGRRLRPSPVSPGCPANSGRPPNGRPWSVTSGISVPPISGPCRSTPTR